MSFIEISSEDYMETMVVGLYDRGIGQPDEHKIFNIGTSKILKSGIWSPYLVNLRPALSFDQQSYIDRATQAKLRTYMLDSYGDALSEIEQERPFDHIFGLPEAGTPLASAVAASDNQSLLWQRIVDKSGRGSHQQLEGIYYEGQKVVQIDDVVTSAKTKQEGAEYLNSVGLTTSDVVVFIDREQGGREAVEALGLNLTAVLGAKALFGYLLAGDRISQTEHDYLMEYTNNPAPETEPADHPWKNNVS